MREIKFRAWHRGEKKETGRVIIPAQMLYDTKPGDCLVWLSHGQNIEQVMQFTGLLDKNGKAIYEGDVIKLVVDHGAILGGKKPCKAVVRWDAEDAGFFFETDTGNFPHVKPWMAVSVEVIGNIHQDSQFAPTLSPNCKRTAD